MSKSYKEMAQESTQRNLSRAVSALKKLESAKEGTCVGCGKKVYRDACVLLRPGFWIAPASFHENGCPVATVMTEMMKEVASEEQEMDKQWHREHWARPENQAILKRAKELSEKLAKEIEESETAKYN